MSRYQLLATAFVASLCSSIVSAETFDDYLSQLASHPSVTHIIEQGNSFENLATSALSLPDPQLILGVDNIPFSDPSFDRFLPSAKVIGFRQAIPNPAVREKRASFQKSQSKKQRLMAEYQEQRLRALFTRQLIDLKKVSDLEALLKKQLELYRLMEKDLKGQLEAGKPFTDVFQR